MNDRTVLIAGIGGASVGAQLARCLSRAGGFNVYGCDISARAYGHFDPVFSKTFILEKKNYVHELRRLIETEKPMYLIAGGEPTMRIINRHRSTFDQLVTVVQNTPETIDTFADKSKASAFFTKHDIPAPKSWDCAFDQLPSNLAYPCIIKPSNASGGSQFVFAAENEKTLILHMQLFKQAGLDGIIQEYIPHDEGEYSAGVLLGGQGKILSVVIYRRQFQNKLSISYQFGKILISSPYGEGRFDTYPRVRDAVERIAANVDSIGPLNIQGRMKAGRFLPFEVNPRFSGSVYMRALSGVNEPSLLIDYLETGAFVRPLHKRGMCVRSLSEIFIEDPAAPTGC